MSSFRFGLLGLSVLVSPSELFFATLLLVVVNGATPPAPRPEKPKCASEAVPSVFLAVFLLLELSGAPNYILCDPLLFCCRSVLVAAVDLASAPWLPWRLSMSTRSSSSSP